MEFKKDKVLNKKDIVIIKKKDLFKYTNNYEKINSLNENKSNNEKLLENELDTINNI